MSVSGLVTQLRVLTQVNAPGSGRRRDPGNEVEAGPAFFIVGGTVGKLLKLVDVAKWYPAHQSQP